VAREPIVEISPASFSQKESARARSSVVSAGDSPDLIDHCPFVLY
jgi:hypothetical protein